MCIGEVHYARGVFVQMSLHEGCLFICASVRDHCTCIGVFVYACVVSVRGRLSVRSVWQVVGNYLLPAACVGVDMHSDAYTRVCN